MENFEGNIRSVKVYGNDFWSFFHKQNSKVQQKILWTIRIVRDLQIIPEKYFKHLSDTDGIYEIRVSYGTNIFRIFCFFDEGKLVILLNAFQKKTQKTPISKIEKAKKLKKDYYENK